MAKRGRPPLSDEERAERIKNQPKKTNKAGFSSTKAGGYAAQKRYKEKHKGELYEPKIRIPQECRETLDSLIASTGFSITRLFVNAVEEKYGVTLHKTKEKE